MCTSYPGLGLMNRKTAADYFFIVSVVSRSCASPSHDDEPTISRGDVVFPAALDHGKPSKDKAEARGTALDRLSSREICCDSAHSQPRRKYFHCNDGISDGSKDY